MERGHEKASQMRALAARLRGHAAETSLKIFQDKLQAMAADLEEAARRCENAALGQEPARDGKKAPPLKSGKTRQ